MLSTSHGAFLLPLLARVASAAFGITTSDESYVIDAGSVNPLTLAVSRESCDITSINYYGSELQYASKGSHIGSGLGSAAVNATENGKLCQYNASWSRLLNLALQVIISR